MNAHPAIKPQFPLWQAEHIARSLGGQKTGGGWICRCPSHDDRSPSLSISDGKDGTLLVCCHAGCDGVDVLHALKNAGAIDSNGKAPSSDWIEAKRKKIERENILSKERAGKIWKKAATIVPDGTVSRYLASRGIDGGIPSTLRQHQGLQHVETNGNRPTMVGAVRTWPDTEVHAVHRTFLTDDGNKVDQSAKKMLGPVKGGAVQLALIDLEKPLVLSEGIETALSVQMATGFPTWACLSTGGLYSVIVPDPSEIKEIIIAGDHDPVDERTERRPGEHWATKKARKLEKEGHIVRIALPNKEGDDWNDVHMADGLEAVRLGIEGGVVVEAEHNEVEESLDGAVSIENEIARLAELPPFEYEQCRSAEAKRLYVRTKILDQEVEARRPADGNDETVTPFADVEPWPDPVELADLLDKIAATLSRFLVLPDHTAEAIALWIAHCWNHDATAISPILAIESPEKRCGKTTAISVVSALVPRPMHTTNMTPAVLFRVVEKFKPTVLIDEGDTFLKDNDELRNILNGGHNRLSAVVWRTVGDDHEPKGFRVWAPKAIALIGRLPDTLADRSIAVKLRRKRPEEVIERFRIDRIAEFLPICRKLRRWSEDNAIRLSALDPDIPADMHDRAADNWRPLIAIADAGGGDWPDKTRRIANALSALIAEDNEVSAGVLLLQDCESVFQSKGVISIKASDLVDELCELEESPWSDWRRGEPITSRGLARLLKRYGIKSQRERDARYYRAEHFQDAVERYVHDRSQGTPFASVTSVNPLKNNEKIAFVSVTDKPDCDTCDSENINKINAVTLVTDKGGSMGAVTPKSGESDVSEGTL